MPLRIRNCLFALLWATLMSSAPTGDVWSAGDLGSGARKTGPVWTKSFLRKVKFNYTIRCQGCHTKEGVGLSTPQEYIPPLRNYIGYFLQVPGGRDYLVRVPGVSQSHFNDQQTADLLNYVIYRFADDSLNGDFAPYTSQEVKKDREKGPLRSVSERRGKLVAEINSMLEKK